MASTSESGPFRIQVLEGTLASTILQTNQPAGRIELSGRTGPYRPIRYSQRQRVKTTWYPGNPEATQQVIGPTKEPTVVTGRWPDVFLGDGAAMTLVDLFEAILDQGPLLEVTWGDNPVATTQPRVRRGILTRFDYSPERPQDIGWEMEFTWRGTGASVLSPLTATDIVNPREGALDAVAGLGNLATVTGAFLQQLSTRLFKVAASVERSIGDAVTGLDQAANGIANASSAITAFTTIPQQAVSRLVGSYTTALQNARALRNTLLHLDKTALAVVDDAKTVMTLQIQILTLLAQVDNVTDLATRGFSAAQQQQVPTVVAEVRVPPGTDLRQLAQQFYGDPDLWTAIARFNGYPTSAVPTTPSGPSDDPAPPTRIPRQDGSSSLFATHLSC